MDLDKLLRLDISYPGISFGYHSWALGVYLESLEEFIGYAGEQYRLRAKRALDARKDELGEVEYMQEAGYVDEAAEEHIPGYARMSAVVLLWGIFESTVFDITAYVARRESAPLKLREIRSDSFLKQVQKYCPSITIDDLLPYRTGVRAMAVMRDGTLVDDFLLVESPRSMHVCNAPSPAATSAIPIGAYICDKIADSQ